MAHEEGYGTYSFLTTVITIDDDVVSNFGYRIEKQFKEDVIRKIMLAAAEVPHVVSVTVNPVSTDLIERVESYQEIEDEEEEDY